MSLAGLLQGDTATVTPYTGESAYGPTYADAVAVPCRAEFDRRLVRNSQGDEVVSEATLYMLPTVAGQPVADLFRPESRVSINGQRDSQVISVSPQRGARTVAFVAVTLQ